MRRRTRSPRRPPRAQASTFPEPRVTPVTSRPRPGRRPHGQHGTQRIKRSHQRSRRSKSYCLTQPQYLTVLVRYCWFGHHGEGRARFGSNLGRCRHARQQWPDSKQAGSTRPAPPCRKKTGIARAHTVDLTGDVPRAALQTWGDPRATPLPRQWT